MYIYYSLNKSIPEEVSDIDQQTVITEDGAKQNKWLVHTVIWCFMPSQPLQLHQGNCAHIMYTCVLVFYAQSTSAVISGRLCTQNGNKRLKKIMLTVLDELLERMLSLVSVLFCQNSKDFIMTASLWLLCWLLWFNYTMACCLIVRTCMMHQPF